MDSSSPTSGPEARSRAAGFTLLEVMLATVITAIVMMGVLSAYMFLGRSLLRQGGEARLEAQSRIAIAYFTQDVSAATSVDPTNMTATSLSLYEPSSTIEITYTYAGGTLTRTTTGGVPGPASLVLTSNLTGLTFNYYNFVPATSATAPTPPPAAGVKEINMALSLANGSQSSGSLTTYVVTSPRVALKNKVLLGQSPGIP